MTAYALGAFLFALGIALTIALHEFGHLIVARLCHMRVRRYFIGFGPTVFSFRKGHTEYGLKAVPLGGFCDIAGMTNQDEVTEEEAPHAMRNKPWWQRVLVLSGGVAMNILIGVCIIYGLAVSAGIPNPQADLSARVGETTCVSDQVDAQNVAPCVGAGPAAEAGVKTGDIIRSVNGTPVANFVELRDRLWELPGQDATLGISRGEEELEIVVPVSAVKRLDAEGNAHTRGAIGIASAPPKDAIKSYGPIAAVPATAEFTGQLLGATVKGLAAFPGKVPGVVNSIFGGERQADGPISVVGATRIGGEVAQHSAWSMFFMMLASLNFFLALFNIVPLPPLDGGHIVVVLYEKIRDALRKARGLAPAGPADYAPLLPITAFVAAVLMLVGGLIIIADVVNPVRLFH